MNFCKDCKYFEKGGWGYHLCTHPKFMIEYADPVTGEGRVYCQIMRKYEIEAGGCGVNGDYWEKRVSF